MKRITRTRRLTAAESAKYRKLRRQIAGDLPELFARHRQRMAALDDLQEVVMQLKAARTNKGLSLTDMKRLTGMDRAAISKLENGQRPNLTVDTLVRYANALGKRISVALSDK